MYGVVSASKYWVLVTCTHAQPVVSQGLQRDSLGHRVHWRSLAAYGGFLLILSFTNSLCM